MRAHAPARSWLQGTALALIALAVAACEKSADSRSGANPQDSSSATAKLATQPASTAPAQPQGPATQAAERAPVSTNKAAELPREYVAYYFHRTIRCPTCLSIESQSRDAINLLFPDRVSFHPVNIEEPGNEHFEKDFSLETQSLVLVEMTSEEVVRWKLLPKTWELVDDPLEFKKYVVREVATFVAAE